MQLKLEIVSFQKSLMGEGHTHTFSASGGSIGRSRDNAWILPDPNRYVSSCHAVVDFADGRFRITDTSTNGVFVNGSGTALGRDQRANLSDGDRLVLGDYEIAVRLQDAGQQSKPAAPLTAARPTAARPTGTRPTGILGVSEPQPPQDILDVVGSRRAEPRLGRPAITTEPPAQSGIPMPPPRSRPPAPLPPSPPRPAGPLSTLSAPTGIPEDFDLPAAARPSTTHPSPPRQSAEISSDQPPSAGRTQAGRPPAPPLVSAPTPLPTRPMLPDDLDDLLPGSTAPKPPVSRVAAPPELTPAPPVLSRTSAPSPAVPTAPPALPDEFDDLIPPPPGREATTAPSRVLPDGVPLLRPVPGTGNRPDPLSPTPRSAPSIPSVSLPNLGDDSVINALADGLGLDPDALAGPDALAMVTLTSRAARAAALGIADALDARAALARASGVDPRALDRGTDNPFVLYRSGEEALKRALTQGPGQGQPLDAATRQSVATLTVNAAAAAAALEALLAHFDGEAPPRTSTEAREIFGTAFLNAYHREISRLD